VPKTDGTGGYRDDVYTATFSGYIGRSKPKYVVVLRVDEGSAASGFSGFNSAKPVFVGIANGIMDNVPISD
jgi:cell division protein FtsI/penicillin-binding protein 2